MIIDALMQTGESRAAGPLGPTKGVMRYRIQKLGIDPSRSRPGKPVRTPPR